MREAAIFKGELFRKRLLYWVRAGFPLLSMVTVAPATGAPDASITTPVIDPLLWAAFCATTGAEASITAAKMSDRSFRPIAADDTATACGAFTPAGSGPTQLILLPA